MNIYELIDDLAEDQIIKSKSTNFLVLCIEAKVLIERWGNITTDFFVSPNIFERLKFSTLWAANIQSSSLVKDNEVIAVGRSLGESETPRDTKISKCITDTWMDDSLDSANKKVLGL
jgi:hypothetical protein